MELISRKDVVEVALSLMIEVNLGVMNDTNKHLVKQIANEVLYDVIKRVYDIPTVEERKEERWTKFYYVESIDDYWIGEDLGDDCTLYYAKWDNKLGFVFSTSRYLPWGEHVVSSTSLWKEYTYPSKPKEIPFTDWIVGFVKKYFKGE